MKSLIIAALISLTACRGKGVHVFVHHESLLSDNFSYTIYVDNKKMIKDSIKFTGNAPNFNEYFFKKNQGTLKLNLDTISKQIAINSQANSYSFFLLSDSSSGKNTIRILVREHMESPTFY